MKSFFNRKKKNNNNQYKEVPISSCLEINLEKVKEIFEYPTNMDFIMREIYIKPLNKNSTLIYIQGAADKAQIEQHIIAPLLENVQIEIKEGQLADIMSKVLHAAVLKKITTLSDITNNIILGNTILFVDGYAEAISIGTSGFESRSVEQTKIENVIKGPKEAFVESLEMNRSLIRKFVQNEKLVAERIKLGEKSSYEISVMYIKDIADPELVEKVKKRVREIKVDGMIGISQLEQHIEERPYSLVPTVLNTERPDRAASFLNEGYVVLIDHSPGCLVLPVTIWSFFHSAEDQYQRWPYANFIRIIRLISYMIALFTPGAYIALSVFHVAMVPTDLLLSIAATRELVPFPVFLEVLIMEISFELIREAGARVPSPLGSTISIVGALILGQAAVQAGIISPILVIVVAITGLASYAIPENSTNYMIRIGRFAYMLIGAFMGFYGLALFFAGSLAYMVSIKSFNVPFFAPKAPYYPSSKDTFLRPPVWKQWLRPFFTDPQDKVRAKNPKERSNQ
ncbi:spore germination protein [Pseudobacteroides cellulosolvens]|uniref:GerA spore germination protein n=1 Tax=Pseudobacteroides cellulosolvens ATCC 35603 = DSM 2933 TaxID=398512 RepID=A0A0L6JTG0_9FIRM|nr:spore germination protein [Pseudobacteroides cellulosolvens]KNY28970.1 GerA spore germination protein [Pseudobacteroides cellulosolvens ATCC 35603 = DSM 2933]